MRAEGFEWRPLPYFPEPVALYVGGSEVARMCRRLDGTWYAVLDQQLGHDLKTVRDCTSFGAGKAGCEDWATRHLKRLEAEVAERWAKNKDRVG